MPRSAPVPKKQGKDQREWTSPQQKEYLSILRPSFVKARAKGAAKAWFDIELAAYFAAFPIDAVTVEEGVIFGKEWTERDKWLREENVSY